MTQVNSVGAIILAAGNSSRMKSPKPLLAFDTNITFIQKIISTYLNWGCNKVTIVTNKQLSENAIFLNFPEKCSIVVNEHIEFERFYSVKLGTHTMSDMDYCFLQDADNPFTSDITLNTLFSNKVSDGVAIPSYKNKGGHPILIGKKSINFLVNYSSDTGNLKEILQQQPTDKIEVKDPSILTNINTPEDYDLFFNKKEPLS